MEARGQQGGAQHPAVEESPSPCKEATPKENTPQGTQPSNGPRANSQDAASSGESSNGRERQEGTAATPARISPKGESTTLLMNSVVASGGSRASGGPMCRICHDGDVPDDLISPCLCTGSVALVHRGCLERWLNMATSDTCELCGFKYPLLRTVRPFWQASPDAPPSVGHPQPHPYGPHNHGPPRPGPPHHGPRHPGPPHHGPRHPGPPHHGPRHPGPRRNGPRHPGPLLNGPANPGPPRPGPRNYGPSNPTFSNCGPLHSGPVRPFLHDSGPPNSSPPIDGQPNHHNSGPDKHGPPNSGPKSSRGKRWPRRNGPRPPPVPHNPSASHDNSGSLTFTNSSFPHPNAAFPHPNGPLPHTNPSFSHPNAPIPHPHASFPHPHPNAPFSHPYSNAPLPHPNSFPHPNSSIPYPNPSLPHPNAPYPHPNMDHPHPYPCHQSFHPSYNPSHGPLPPQPNNDVPYPPTNEPRPPVTQPGPSSSLAPVSSTSSTSRLSLPPSSSTSFPTPSPSPPKPNPTESASSSSSPHPTPVSTSPTHSSSSSPNPSSSNPPLAPLSLLPYSPSRLSPVSNSSPSPTLVRAPISYPTTPESAPSRSPLPSSPLSPPPCSYGPSLPPSPPSSASLPSYCIVSFFPVVHYPTQSFDGAGQPYGFTSQTFQPSNFFPQPYQPSAYDSQPSNYQLQPYNYSVQYQQPSNYVMQPYHQPSLDGPPQPHQPSEPTYVPPQPLNYSAHPFQPPNYPQSFNAPPQSSFYPDGVLMTYPAIQPYSTMSYPAQSSFSYPYYHAMPSQSPFVQSNPQSFGQSNLVNSTPPPYVCSARGVNPSPILLPLPYGNSPDVTHGDPPSGPADDPNFCGPPDPPVNTTTAFSTFLLKCDNGEARRACKVDLMCLFLLTPVAMLTVYLCIIGAIQYSQEDQVSFAVFTEGASRFQRRGRKPQGIPGEQSGERFTGAWEPVVLVVGAIILIVIYCCWASLTLKYHIRIWRQWRVINQDVTLAYRQPCPSPPHLVMESAWTPSPGRDAETRPLEQRSQGPSAGHI